MCSTARAGEAPTPANPFAPSASANAPSAATADAPLELRGIMGEGDDYMFSIFDSAKKTSVWARLNEPGREFVVKTFDAARDSITVENQGRTLTLALKAAKVLAAPAMAMRQNPTPVGGPVVLNPTPADEQRRLEAVATEVRRRRAMREQAAQNANQIQK